MTGDIRKSLRSIDLFADLSDTLIDQLASFAMIRTVRAGETIFCQGEPSPYCFGVVSGEVAIQRVSKDRRFPSKVLGVLGPGSLFGESAFFADSPRMAMASANKNGDLVAILGTKLREWVQKEPAAGVPLAMGLLQSSIGRLRQTNHELTVVYGVGRTLGGAKPLEERLRLATDFLQNSLESVDGVLLYHRSPYWDEFEGRVSLPVLKEMPVISLDNPLLAMVQSARGAVSLFPSDVKKILKNVGGVWENPASAAIVPLIDRDQSTHPLQGLLILASQQNPNAFLPNTLLVLSALSDPFAEAMSRERREEDASAQSRLRRARSSFPL